MIRRERGSSAWRGNCDATLYLEAGKYDPKRGEAQLTLTALKVRDTERPAPLHLVPTLLRYSLLRRGDRVGALRAAAALRKLDPADAALDAETFGDWLRRHGQSDEYNREGHRR